MYYRMPRSGLDQIADYVVVGAGSAGAVLAGRLAAAGADVIVLEAGGTDRRPDVLPPVGIVTVNMTSTWRYPTDADPTKGEDGGVFGAGRIVGGGGSVNAMVYVRGTRDDYDGWAKRGAQGWSYDEVLPHFRALENWVEGPDDYRGSGGPISVSWCGNRHPVDEAFVAAAVEAGHPRNHDYNGADQIGVSFSQVNQRRGRRSSSAAGFLRNAPADRRPRVLTHARVRRLLLESGRVTGVECAGAVVRAREEVLLCAGAIGSPALLMASGIGPGGEAANLPGVGLNFQDHLVVSQSWRATVPTMNTIGLGGAVRGLVSYARSGTGPLTVSPFETCLFTPDFQIASTSIHYGRSANGKVALPRIDGFTIYCVLTHPRSRGEVRLKGGQPIIRHHRLADRGDVDELLRGAGLVRDIVGQSAMRSVAADPLTPLDGDETAWLAANEASIHHPVGTCRMGDDCEAVVDHLLRVHGVPGLRVVDASVMPSLPSGNTNAATMMIAHRASDLVLHG